MKLFPASSRDKDARGFTLVEIILAIGITIGLFVVVLFFYQQASQVRAQMLTEVEHASGIRLFLDQFARELQTAHNDDFLIMGLTGTSNYIEFVTTTPPQGSAWATPTVLPRSDLHLLRYRLETDIEGGFVWLTRDEEVLVETTLPLTSLDSSAGGTTQTTNKIPSNSASIDVIRQFSLRYWNGSAWQDTWSAWDLPAGVEVTVSYIEPSEEAKPAEDAEQVFRRVIYLPQHGAVALLDRQSSVEEEDLP